MRLAETHVFAARLKSLHNCELQKVHESEDAVASTRDAYAPPGVDGTNEIVDTWADGRFGLNNEKGMVSYSTNGGNNWSSSARRNERNFSE